jgi:hypothetical protein
MYKYTQCHLNAWARLAVAWALQAQEPHVNLVVDSIVFINV